jgi:hypothetical protein
VELLSEDDVPQATLNAAPARRRLALKSRARRHMANRALGLSDGAAAEEVWRKRRYSGREVERVNRLTMKHPKDTIKAGPLRLLGKPSAGK